MCIKRNNEDITMGSWNKYIYLVATKFIIERKIKNMDDNFEIYIHKSNMDSYFTDFAEEDYISMFNKYTKEHDSYLLVVDMEPYVRALLFINDNLEKSCYKYVFIDDLKWDYWSENSLIGITVDRTKCYINQNFHMDIFKKYSTENPEWHLKPYYSFYAKLLFHIHHCQIKGTKEELLFKAGLDVYAVRQFRNVKLKNNASTPSEIFDFVPLRVLKALNTERGAEILDEYGYRKLLIHINKIHPDWFKHILNEYECECLKKILNCCIKYEEKNGGIDISLSEVKKCNDVGKKIDSLIDKGIKQILPTNMSNRDIMLSELKKYKSKNVILKNYLEKNINKNNRLNGSLYLYLIREHKFYSKLFRYRRHDVSKFYDDCDGYIVNLHKTIDDFCAEAIYQNNCLLRYINFHARGYTTILFMRKKEYPNTPYITIEIRKTELVQAYYKNNKELNEEDTDWIIDYCTRHNIVIDFDYVRGLNGADGLNYYLYD